MGSVGNKASNVIDATSRFKQQNTPSQEQKQQEGTTSRGNGWNYRGITEAIDKLEAELNKTKSGARVASIYNALKAEDKVITAELESGDGDKSVLLTQRRRVRTLLRRITNG